MAEENRSVWKTIGQILIDIPEKHVAALTFSVMFIVFVLQIFFRYVLNRPLIWPYEVSILTFIWTVMLGACYAKRDNVHVVFNLVYDRQKPLGQLIFRTIGNVAMITAFCIALFPTYKYIQFMNHDRTVDLQIPKNIVFGPYMVFMVIIIGRVTYDLVTDIRKLVRGEIR